MADSKRIARVVKNWGWKLPMPATSGVASDFIFIREGEACSVHRHDYKWNRFVVVDGSLVIREYSPDGLAVVKKSKLVIGDMLDIPPDVVHQFYAETDVFAIEMYWGELAVDDIVRFRNADGSVIPV